MNPRLKMMSRFDPTVATLLVVLYSLTLAAGDVVQIGKCPDLSVQEDFNPELVSIRKIM